jgi:dolichyl-phosphate-mannose--protein O-mannosyl transferase
MMDKMVKVGNKKHMHVIDYKKTKKKKKKKTLNTKNTKKVCANVYLLHYHLQLPNW